MGKITRRVATDVGGTFTDLVCFETDTETGASRVITAKTDPGAGHKGLSLFLLDTKLPGATLLDDVTGPETFYGVFCARPVALERLRDAVEADPDAPRLPGECVIDRVRVEKRDGR